MEKGSFQAMLGEGNYNLSPSLSINPAVQSSHPYYVAETEPYDLEYQLPDLWSIDQFKNGAVIRDTKRVKTTSSYRDVKGKERRQNISEKLRSLHKLLPSDRKMDTGTMLEEANKYVRFLQAQVSVLQSMPLSDHPASAQLISRNADFYGRGLGRLSRQQLLEVVLNSDVTQELMYTQGCCVYSSEQMALLQRVVEERHALSQFLMYHRF